MKSHLVAIHQMLFKVDGRHYNDWMPVGLKLRQKLWWYFVPGTTIKVRWPRGTIVVDQGDPRWYDVGASRVETGSADPNDFYREELERLVGRQGWHWDWGLVGDDVSNDCLTIRICRNRAQWASYFGLKWR